MCLTELVGENMGFEITSHISMLPHKEQCLVAVLQVLVNAERFAESPLLDIVEAVKKVSDALFDDIIES